MTTAALLLTYAISIYDTHDPKKVIVEACKQTCIRVIVPKSSMDQDETIENLVKLIESQQK